MNYFFKVIASFVRGKEPKETRTPHIQQEKKRKEKKSTCYYKNETVMIPPASLYGRMSLSRFFCSGVSDVGNWIYTERSAIVYNRGIYI